MNKQRANKRPKTAAAFLSEVIGEHIHGALPGSHRRHMRNGARLPLSAWMSGAPRNCHSKIFAVKNDEARYPYASAGEGANALARRISERYDVTLLQHSLIKYHVISRYRGREPDCPCTRLGTVNGPIELSFERGLLAVQALALVCKDHRISVIDLPLRALIDKRVTDLLLLLQLKETIERKTPMVCKI